MVAESKKVQAKLYFCNRQFQTLARFPRLQLTLMLAFPAFAWRSPLALIKRSISTSCETKDAVRRLLRNTAQPVAVVTSYYPFDGDTTDANAKHPHFHGATLSSFSSIALDPHPLVAFSLRIPSRMATSLKALMEQKTPSLVVNILSETQADTAIRFSRPDLYTEPFRITPYTLSADGLPILNGSLVALSCTLVNCIPLHNLCG